nr:MAG TPA: hypothetical protein [Caudoviricetes sp.]
MWTGIGKPLFCGLKFVRGRGNGQRKRNNEASMKQPRAARVLSRLIGY